MLLYSISGAPEEAENRSAARELLERDDLALSVQVLQEFYVQATRATRADALPHAVAAEFIELWCRYPVQELSLGVLRDALEIRAAFGFSYRNAAIVAAAQAAGCRELLTEDLSHGQKVGELTIVNPFL